MTKEEIMQHAIGAKIISYVGGKVDASYCPPAHLEDFAKRIIESCAKACEELGDKGYGPKTIARELRGD